MKIRAALGAVVIAVMSVGVLTSTTAAHAEGVALPHLTFDPSSAGFVDPDYAPVDITVHGRECVPKDGMPASVLMTVDNLEGVFSATPDENGDWAITINLDPKANGTEENPLSFGWIVHASCDNYLGSNAYPDAPIPVAVAIADSAGPGDPPIDTAGGSGGVADTGARVAPLAVVAASLLALGLAFVLAGRPRREQYAIG